MTNERVLTMPARGPSLSDIVTYFLKLGVCGFGGPVVLADHMRRDWVDKYGWLTQEEYEEGLAIASACPGPLAFQLAVYCGYVRHGNIGGLLAAIFFAIGPFAIVVVAAYFYTRLSASWQMQATFYGVAPVIVALILKASINLGKKVLSKHKIAAIAMSAAAALITVALRQELVEIFLIAGCVGIYLFRDDEPASAGGGAKVERDSSNGLPNILPAAVLTAAACAVLAISFSSPAQEWLVRYLPADAMKLFLFFFRTGMMVFGSGLVIVPFLKASVVDQYHWLSDQQFIDSVAIGMMSPGPVVITATFVGYVVGKAAGAVASTMGIFMPPLLFTLLGTPMFRRHRNNTRVKGFVRGVSIAVVGVLAGTTVIIATSTIHDAVGVVELLIASVVLLRYSKLPEHVLIVVGAILGLLLWPHHGF